MTLKKVWTTQHQRYGRAAYAEDSNTNIDITMASIASLMSESGTRFYKVEVTENGAYMGYFILKNGILLVAYFRPQFVVYADQFYNLVAETQNEQGYAATVGSMNIRKGENA